MQRATAPKTPPLLPHCQTLPTSDAAGDSLPEPDRQVSALIQRLGGLSGNTAREISAMLGEVVDCFGFRGCGLLSHAGEQSGEFLHYCGCNGEPGGNPAPGGSGLFPWTHRMLADGRVVSFADPGDLPPDAAEDRIRYQAAGVESFLALPIGNGGSVDFSFIAQGRGRSGWDSHTVARLRLVGEIMAISLSQEPRDLQPGRRWQQLICEISARMLDVTCSDSEHEITSALEQVREILALDRLGVATLSDDQRELRVTHFTYGERIAPVPEKVDLAPLFPWAVEKTLRGETVQFSTLDELPAEAAIDRQSWHALGVKSNLTLPIRVAGTVRYLLVGSQVRGPRALDLALVPNLRLVGELFAGALQRCRSDAAHREASAEIERLREKLASEAEHLQVELVSSRRHLDMVGQSTALARTLSLAEQVAPTDSTVLITGETGTGKELVAQVIHKLSARHNRQIVKVNCASLPAALVESELFGREKGAYTGALTRQAGRFELADGGTIFLDEIAEISLELQAKLLRVLQERQFERLGSGKTIQVDVRVIAATNRNLAEEVKKGNFREDLYYRLNVFQIVVPPLRERIEDIPLLIWSFVHEFGEKMGKKINKISKQDMAALQSYPWPGNVRELRNVLEHAVIVSTGDKLQVRLPENPGEVPGGMRTLEEYEVMHIKDALRLTGWRIKGEGGAAKLLGLNPSTLYSRMQKFGISNRPGKDEISA